MKPRRSNSGQQAQMDRISDLPDCVLTRILSLLPTKLSASTCVLSKRWHFLWTMVYNLDLKCITCRPLEKEFGSATSFVDFVNRFFTMRDKRLSIQRFRLEVMSRCSTNIPVDSWVLDVVSRNVEELDLDLARPLYFRFNCSIFTCKTLVVLKLSKGIILDAPPTIHLPNLKALRLHQVLHANRESFGNLFYGCPVLENLDVRGDDHFEQLRDYVIFSPTLRSLDMDFYFEAPLRLRVDAPLLESLDVEVYESRGIYLKNLGNLVEAVVNLHIDGEYFDEVGISRMVEDTLGALYNVQALKIGQSTMRALFGASFEQLPKFQNLIQLELSYFCCFWRMLLSLLQKLPCLQHLTIRLDLCSDDCFVFLGPEAWAELKVPHCLSHLRTLRFHSAFGRDDSHGLSCDDMEFLTYMLKNSTVLENMTINCWFGLSLEIKHAFRQKLASLERVSEKCELEFDGEVL